MAKQEKTLDEHLLKQKKMPAKTSVGADLVNILIGMVVMVLFITGLVFVIGALLK